MLRIKCAHGFAALSLFSAAHLGFGAVVFSETFASGNPADSSDYALIGPGVFSLPGQYRVVANPGAAFTNGYTSYFDHTLGNADGEMLFFDGAASSSARVWSHTISLVANEVYTFSYWGSAGNNLSNPVLAASINGLDLSGTLAVTNGTWTHYSANLLVSVPGDYTLSIRDVNTEANGNDGAIDDISLSGPVPEPSVAAMGVLPAAALLGRRPRRQ